MPNGDLHTGSSHNAGSQKLFHFDELSSAAKKKAKAQKKPMAKKAAKKKAVKRKSFTESVESRMKESGY